MECETEIVDCCRKTMLVLLKPEKPSSLYHTAYSVYVAKTNLSITLLMLSSICERCNPSQQTEITGKSNRHFDKIGFKTTP